MADTASVREVGLRDGLQLVREMLPSETKLEWCRLQAATGFAEMEDEKDDADETPKNQLVTALQNGRAL